MLLDFLFPKFCLGCRKRGTYLCQDCLAGLKPASSFCPICGKPAIDGVTHFKCHSPLALDGVVSIWVYQFLVRRLILTLKYQFAFSLAGDLAKVASSVLEINHPLMFLDQVLLVSIPAAEKRVRWRGFNQTEIIGRLIAQHFGWRFSPNLLYRKKTVRPQTGLKREERLKNIKGVFGVNPQFGQVLKEGCQIIVFDDVWTTGATLREAGKVLKRKGFQTVWGLTLAKT